MILGQTPSLFFFCFFFSHNISHTKILKQVNNNVVLNKIAEKEGIDKTNVQDCHGKTHLKSQECCYCLNYFFVFKNFKYDFNLCDD